LAKLPKTYDREKIASYEMLLEKLKLDPCFSAYTSINSKCIKDLSIRSETQMLLQERAGNTLEAIGIGNDFLNRTQMAQQQRE
jgi:hypothetical protein